MELLVNWRLISDTYKKMWKVGRGISNEDLIPMMIDEENWDRKDDVYDMWWGWHAMWLWTICYTDATWHRTYKSMQLVLPLYDKGKQLDGPTASSPLLIIQYLIQINTRIYMSFSRPVHTIFHIHLTHFSVSAIFH